MTALIDGPHHRLSAQAATTIAKAELRGQMKQGRTELTRAVRGRLSAVIAERLLALPPIKGSQVVTLFTSFGSEIETAPILRRLHDAGLRTALPVVRRDRIVAIAVDTRTTYERTPTAPWSHNQASRFRRPRSTSFWSRVLPLHLAGNALVMGRLLRPFSCESPQTSTEARARIPPSTSRGGAERSVRPARRRRCLRVWGHGLPFGAACTPRRLD